MHAVAENNEPHQQERIENAGGVCPPLVDRWWKDDCTKVDCRMDETCDD